jgi:predicted nucleic acid-binding protein
MRLALDTNVLGYAEGVNGAAMRRAALEIIEKLPADSTFLPVQVLAELFHVLVRKAGRSPQRARAAILSWQDTFPVIETSGPVLLGAMDLATGHGLSLGDAVICAAAWAAGCRLLLSEDLQAGFTWNGVTIANPFSKQTHELLTGFLGQ